MSGQEAVDLPDGFTIEVVDGESYDGHAIVRVQFETVDALRRSGMTYPEAVQAELWAVGVGTRAVAQIVTVYLDELRFEHRCDRSGTKHSTRCGGWSSSLRGVDFLTEWTAELWVPPERVAEFADLLARELLDVVEVDRNRLRDAVEDPDPYEDAGPAA